jgi:hypothetical protein
MSMHGVIMPKPSLALFALLLALLPPGARALTTIDFEGLGDSTVLDVQYAGLSFGHAVVLTAGVTLNEIEFPPHGGSNVASDDGGAMQLSFAAPVQDFSGYFTYAERLTLTAFDSGGNLVATSLSQFTNNLALSGVVGSAPNEPIELVAAGGIQRIVIAGNAAGGSFVVDDLAITAVPEPRVAMLLAAGLAALTLRRRRRG